MTIYLVAFVGGVLTIGSPCILPVLPFVFTRTAAPLRRGAFPLLAGMALTFAFAGALAGIAGQWVVRWNQLGRALALVIVAVLGVMLAVPSVSDLLSGPLVQLGATLQRRVRHGPAGPTIGGSLLIGMSTGFLWTPCAGPILGLVLATAALEDSRVQGFLLLLAFAGGAATALAIALFAGSRISSAARAGLAVEPWIRRGTGVAVLAGVATIAAGLDVSLLARLSLTTIGTATAFEQRLVDRARTARAVGGAPASLTDATSARAADSLADLMPPLAGAIQWLNGPPRTREELRGRVVLVSFWTYSCIYCLRALPYLRAWAEKYESRGLVVVGVHTPEFAFERDPVNVARAARDLQLTFSIAVDSNHAIWSAFGNEYWPAIYLVDAEGIIRSRYFGEGEYEQTESEIQQLLAARMDDRVGGEALVAVAATGILAPADFDDIQSPETYIGYDRQEHFASPEQLVTDRVASYTLPPALLLNQWALAGRWIVGREEALSMSPGGRISFRFRARDLHLVLAGSTPGTPVRYRVTLDGKPPLEHHGVDSDPQGYGVVTEPRLYQLIRQQETSEARTFEIEFLDAGVHAFVFTFG